MKNRNDAPIMEIYLKQQYNTNKTQKLALDIKNTKNQKLLLDTNFKQKYQLKYKNQKLIKPKHHINSYGTKTK